MRYRPHREYRQAERTCCHHQERGGAHGFASCDASQGPAIAPNVPPTAITPKSRLLCSSEKRSTIRAQKTIVAKKLNTLNQTKKTIPLASPMAAGANTNRAKNTSRLAAKKR